MYTEVPCPLCGGDRRKTVFPATRPQKPIEPDDLACTTAELASYDQLVRCLDCGVHYTSPRPASGEIVEGYRRMADRGFVEESRARELTYRRLLRSIDRIAGGGSRGRLLDAGCSMGFFVKQALAAGWRAEGIDPSRWAVEYARNELGLVVHEGPISAVNLEPESFDVITLWDVVEHLMDPVADVRHLARALKPGGVFGLSTHSISSPAARVLGRRYPFLQVMHATHFTPGTTGRLFEMAGLKQVRTSPHLRTLRTGYLVKKIAQKSRLIGSMMGVMTRALGLSDFHVVITGLGIFNAFAVKPPREG